MVKFTMGIELGVGVLIKIIQTEEEQLTDQPLK